MKRSFFVFLAILLTASLGACSFGGDDDLETSVLGDTPSEPILGPLRVEDCEQMRTVYDEETGLTCLIGVAVEKGDATLCDLIEKTSSYHAECLQAVIELAS